MFADKTALITGASSGLGKEFARQLAGRGCNLILVARRETLMNTLKTELEGHFPVTVTVDTADLTNSDECYRLVSRYADKVDVLINNAGKGMWGTLLENTPQECENILRLNTIALTILSHGFASAMVNRHSGHILQVASIGCFVIGAKSSVYHSSKAYVANLGESLRKELAPYGVVCSVLCPGMTESEFYTASNHPLNDKGQNALASVESVVSGALEALQKGKRFYVPGLQNRVEAFFLSKMPRNWISWFYNRRMKSHSRPEAYSK